jgi:phosphoglycolate phosphatase
MSGRINLAVFDCDGTIVDSQHSIVTAMHTAFNALSLDPPPAESIKRTVGLTLLEVVARLFPEGKVETHQQLRDEYRKAYSMARDKGHIHDPLFPGLKQALDELESAGWILGVATGKSHVGLVNTLQSHNLLERFLTIQTADKAAGKPSPEMLLNAMAETGADPQNTVMIGDTTFDIEMANNAGTLALGVAWGYHGENELIDAGARAIVQDCAGISKTITNVLKVG